MANSSFSQPVNMSIGENLEEDFEWIVAFRFGVEGVVQGVVGLAGLVGNALSIVVLTRQEMDLKPTFRQILITLISFDIGCIVFNLLLFCLPQISIDFFVHVFPYIVPFVLPFAQIAMTGSIYSTLAVAIERYVSVCHPHRKPPTHCGLIAVILLVGFAIGFNVCRFLEFETTYRNSTHSYVDLTTNRSVHTTIVVAEATTTALRVDPLYSQITMVLMLVVNGIIPLKVLVLLNQRIYAAIRTRNQRLLTMSSKQRRDFDVAAVLVGIILVFIVCHSFKFFVNCYEAYIVHFGMDMESAWSSWTDAVVSFSHLLATVNSSLNFIIYCYKDPKFRQSLGRVLGLHGGHPHPVAVRGAETQSLNGAARLRCRTSAETHL